MKTNKQRLTFAEQQNKLPVKWDNIRKTPFYVTVGEGSNIHKSVIFASQGYGYEWDGEKYLHINHTGRIIIGDNVDIHPGCIITRGTAKSNATTIGEGTKIGTFTLIAHNAIIGKHCLIGGMVSVAGSCVIGNNVKMAGHVYIKNKVRIGDNCEILAGSVVRKDLPAGTIYKSNT